MENEPKQGSGIKFWAVDDRPREKLALKGAEALSDSELLAILINSGNKEKTAVDLAKEILQLGRNDLEEVGKLSLKQLQKVKGIGVARAITIAAALELGRRRQQGSINVLRDVDVLKSSKAVATYLQMRLQDHQHEVFAVLYLNNANKIKHFEIVSKGGLTSTVADPRIIFKIALEQNASSLVLCHNHPSGKLEPSPSDKLLTEKIQSAAAHLDMRVLDHIIVSTNGYYSFADEGLI